MSSTITEKILAAHCGKNKVSPGEFIEADVDLVLANDITTPIGINEFKSAGFKSVFNNEKIVLTPDHFSPAKDIKSAEQIEVMRDFAKEQKLRYFFEVGRCGIEHVFLPEQGLVAPGELVIGADSHTCTYGALGCFSTGVGSSDFAAAIASGKVWLKVPESILFNYKGKLKKWVYGKDLILYTIGKIGVDGAIYRAMEFTGEAIKNLSMDSRFSICNMAVEAGAKNGIIEPDPKTEKYLKGRVKREYKIYKSNEDANYSDRVEIDCSNIEPQVAFPSLPSNTKPVSEAGNVEIDQAVIGSCTNGRIEDLEAAAGILKGKKVHKNVRLVVFPATQHIYLEAMKKGWLKIFVEAGGSVSTPTCGPCLGGHMGVLAAGEKAIATTNRNFVGRMGHQKSEVYLSNAAVAAASAVAGKIVHPDLVKGK